MAANVPVVVSSYGGLSEVVGDSGLILKDTSVSEIRGAIIRLHTDKTLRKRLAAKGKERSSIFHPKKIAKEMVSVYEKLLSSS
jgi:glycosyltransferase involved in cell wall biosynthesis